MNIVKKMFPKGWEWMETNPKKVFFVGLFLIITSYISSFVWESYYAENDENLLRVKEYTNMQEARDERAKIVEEKDAIAREMIEIRDRVAREGLTKEDSLRIIYLTDKHNSY